MCYSVQKIAVHENLCASTRELLQAVAVNIYSHIEMLAIDMDNIKLFKWVTSWGGYCQWFRNDR